MDLKQLEYFVHVAELGSVTKASDLLGVAQSALSRHVRKLEAQLGQHLFLRDGRGVRTTEAGKRLLSHGRSILLQVHRAEQEVADVRGMPVGGVMIGLPHWLSRILTVPFVRAFQKEFPRAQLSITEGLTSHLHEWLLSGRLDIALLYDPVPHPGVDTMPLQQDAYFLICRCAGLPEPPQDIRFADLVNYPLILPRRPHPMRMQLETELAKLGKKPSVALEIDSVPAIADLVAEGLGCGLAILDALRIPSRESKVDFHRIVSPPMYSTLVLAVSAERPTTTLVQCSVTLLREMALRELQRRPGAARGRRDTRRRDLRRRGEGDRAPLRRDGERP
ncbi:MAG: LysR family transcriptional regulator [Lautropia sp.]